jgi:hypothetical protein
VGKGETARDVLAAKLAEPLPDLGDKIRLYIQEHFHDTHPDAFKHDIAQLASLRKQFIEYLRSRQRE